MGARGTGTGHAAPPALKRDPGLGCNPDARPDAGLQTGRSSSQPAPEALNGEENAQDLLGPLYQSEPGGQSPPASDPKVLGFSRKRQH